MAVAASRALTAADDGLVLRCAPGITLTVAQTLEQRCLTCYVVNVLIPDGPHGAPSRWTRWVTR